jgi:hypothetical protein
MGISAEDSLQTIAHNQELLIDAIELGTMIVQLYGPQFASCRGSQTVEVTILEAKALSEEEFHTSACLRALDEIDTLFNRLDTLGEHTLLQVRLLGNIQENDLEDLQRSFKRFVDEGDEFMRLQQEGGQEPIALGHSHNPLSAADRALRSFVDGNAELQVLDRIITNIHATIEDNLYLAKDITESIQEIDSKFSAIAESGRPIEA